jgi:hypothetical protein
MSNENLFGYKFLTVNEEFFLKYFKFIPTDLQREFFRRYCSTFTKFTAVPQSPTEIPSESPCLLPTEYPSILT